jgi:poly(3-hydroxyalkanoate) synthetase
MHLAEGEPSPRERPEPRWASPNRVVLELPSMRLRKFSAGQGKAPTLICAPFSLHGAAIVDFAPGHSLAERLQREGVSPLYVTHWRSATPDMRFFSIDTYLADLNVAVDELGGEANLIGLCQGGWLALVYAARFPAKIRSLVLAGAPVDLAAGESRLSRLAADTPLTVFEEIVRLGHGLVLGERALELWGPPAPDDKLVEQTLQLATDVSPARRRQLAARFRRWNDWTVDLPGTYYLQAVEWLYKENRLTAGRFVALGRRVALSAVKAPVYLLAARDDEVVAPAQVFAAEGLVGTSAGNVRKAIVPGGHLALVMGTQTLEQAWPRIALWLIENDRKRWQASAASAGEDRSSPRARKAG